jgi:phage tail sheath gpL-like
MSGTTTAPVQVPGYPLQNLVPGVYTVVNASNANTATVNQVSLIIGQMITSGDNAGNATPGAPVLSMGVGSAVAAFGSGSQLAIMVERYQQIDNFGTVYCLPLADSGQVVSTSAAQGSAGTTLTFTAGTLGSVAVGETVTGTDIAEDTTVASVNNSAGTVTLSAATTEAVPSGTAITFGASASAATATITFGGTATANGTLPLYIDGNYVPVGINSGQTAANIASNTSAAINAFSTSGGNLLTWVASVSGSVVTLTAVNKGTLANEGTVWLSYRGPSNGEGQFGSPNIAGITVTIVGPSGGATDPEISGALANLPQQPFDFICCPYTDTNNMGSITSFLSDASGRWNWSVELFGGVFTGKGGTVATRSTWSGGNGEGEYGINNQHVSAIGAYESPNPDYHWAVDYTAASAVSLRANPAVPIGGLSGGAALNVLPPLLANQDSFSEQDTLLQDGFSTYVVNASGTVLVQRAVTTYTTNAEGIPDDAYHNVNVPFQLMQWIRAWRAMIATQFNQVILVSDGTSIPPGSQMVTPSTIEYATIALYNSYAAQGLVQNASQFADNVVFTNAGGGVVTCLLPVQLANQLIGVAADLQFTQP